jgi:hypothetical protein
MISRPDLVRRAIKLIGADRKDRTLCESEVRIALQEVDDFRRNYSFVRTKPVKLAARSLYKALDRLRVVLNDKNLPDDLRRMFPNTDGGSVQLMGDCPSAEKDKKGFDDHNDWLPQWRDRAERAGYDKSRFKFYLEADVKRFAADRAYDLLARFDREISAQKKNSAFCKLAALLYRNPEDNLREPCRKALAFWKEDAASAHRRVLRTVTEK